MPDRHVGYGVRPSRAPQRSAAAYAAPERTSVHARRSRELTTKGFYAKLKHRLPFLGGWVVADFVVEDQTYIADDLLLPHPLGRSLYAKPENRSRGSDKSYRSNAEFWRDVLDPQKNSAERLIKLCRFGISEWIPRNPGLFHTEPAERARDAARSQIRGISPDDYDNYLNSADAPPDHANDAIEFRTATSAGSVRREVIYTPSGKLSMLQGGVGCIRLRPVEWKTGGVHWFMSASSSVAPDEGVPLLVPNSIYQKMIDEIRRTGVKICDVIGRTKFIPQQFSDLYSTRYKIQRLYIEVEEIRGINMKPEPAMVSVAASFLSEFEGHPGLYASYVTFDPGYRGAQEGATDWMHEEYIAKFYKGEVLTDFDQQSGSMPNSLFGLDRILTSPDLAETISAIKNKFGYFDWNMLEKASFSFVAHQEQIMVKSVVTGEGNRVNIAGDNSTITVREDAAEDAGPSFAERNRHLYTLLAWASGVVFLAALLVISLIWDHPTQPQLRIQVSILALAAAGFATVVSGLLNVTMDFGRQLVIGASGALAVLVIFYFYNPAVLQ